MSKTLIILQTRRIGLRQRIYMRRCIISYKLSIKYQNNKLLCEN